MRISQLFETMKFAIINNKRLMLIGPPGIGKTAIFNQACDAINEEHKEIGLYTDRAIFHPSISDPTEPKGLPFLREGGETAEFIPYGHLDKLNKATRKVQVLLDDFPQATASVQASYMSLLDRFKDNEYVNFFIAGNRTQDFAASNGILEPIKSRVDSIINVDVSVDDYITYGIKTGMPPSILAFLRFKTGMLHNADFKRDLVNTYCPRTVTSVGNWLNDGLEVKTGNLSQKEAKSILSGTKKENTIKQSYTFEIIAGAVGEAWSIEFIAFERLRQTMPDINKILTKPESVSVPEDPAVLFSLIGSLASRIVPENRKLRDFDKVKKSNFSNALTYMVNVKKEFQVLFVKDTFTYFPNDNLEKIDAFFDWSQDNQDVLI